MLFWGLFDCFRNKDMFTYVDIKLPFSVCSLVVNKSVLERCNYDK